MYLEKEIPLTAREGSELAANEGFASGAGMSSAVSGKSGVAVMEKTAAAEASVKEAETAVPSKTITEKKPFYDFIKRVFDIFCSFFGLIVFSPVFLLISIVILSERTGKRVFYKQKRVGKNGKTIYIHKFRSMVEEADNVERWLDKKQLGQYYREYKISDDPRVTKFGKFLRRTGIDELPQLVNILKGELSLVGPRPIQESELEFYGEDAELLLSVKPGLTGYWQAYCSDGVSYQNHKRQDMELKYVRNRSAAWDMKICFATFGAIIRKAKRGQ